MRTRFGWVALGMVSGCSAYEGDLQGDAWPPSSASVVPTSDLDTGSSTSEDSGDDGPPPAVWYGLDLSFAIAGRKDDTPGGWELGASSLEITLWSEGPEQVCTHAVEISEATDEGPPEGGPALVGWWRLTLENGIPDLPCPDWPARTWQIGLGPYDHRLDPMMAERGSLGFDVYGLYLREDPEGPVYVVGFGGTDAMLLGTPELTVSTAPLPDGAYQARSLVLMSLD